MRVLGRLCLIVLSLSAVTVARADWLHREETIMGTRMMKPPQRGIIGRIRSKRSFCADSAIMPPRNPAPVSRS